MARTVGRDLGISTRQSLEVCVLIRNMTVEEAIQRLTKVTTMEQPVPYRKRASAPHKKGYGPAKYPVKCATAFIRLLEQVQANAQFKGLNASKLEIIHVNAQQASRPYHYGRKRRIQVKNTHVEIVVAEKQQQKKKTETKTPEKTETKQANEQTVKTNKKEQKEQLPKKTKQPTVTSSSLGASS